MFPVRLALISIFILIAGCAIAAEAPKERSIKDGSLISVLDKIDQSPTLPHRKACRLLGVELKLIPEESNEFYNIYRGHNNMWQEAELRLPPHGDDSHFILVLKPVETVSMNIIIQNFGKVFNILTPNPEAGDNGSTGYSYDRPNGKIVFAFPDFHNRNLKSVMFDRM